MSVEKEVTIYGQVYRIKGDDPEDIEAVAEYVDRVMAELLGGPSEDGEPEPLAELESRPVDAPGGGARLPPPRLAVVGGAGTPWHLKSEEEQRAAARDAPDDGGFATDGSSAAR